jgi:hypothetical protein
MNGSATANGEGRAAKCRWYNLRDGHIKYQCEAGYGNSNQQPAAYRGHLKRETRGVRNNLNQWRTEPSVSTSFQVVYEQCFPPPSPPRLHAAFLLLSIVHVLHLGTILFVYCRSFIHFFTTIIITYTPSFINSHLLETGSPFLTFPVVKHTHSSPLPVYIFERHGSFRTTSSYVSAGH